jgi:peroxiredoxin
MRYTAAFRLLALLQIEAAAKSMKHKILGPMGLILAAGVLVWFAMPSYRQGEPSVAGRKANDFAVQVPGISHLADLRGKVVVLNFWASWCPPCIEETDSLNRLEMDIAAKGGVILGVSEDEDPVAYEKFLRDHHVTFPTFRDPTKKIKESYGTSLIPDTYLIDREGRLARKIVSAQDWQSPEIRQEIEILLSKK